MSLLDLQGLVEALGQVVEDGGLADHQGDPGSQGGGLEVRLVVCRQSR